MVKEIVHDPMFLGQKSVDATEDDKHEVDHCNGVLI